MTIVELMTTLIDAESLINEASAEMLIGISDCALSSDSKHRISSVSYELATLRSMCHRQMVEQELEKSKAKVHP